MQTEKIVGVPAGMPASVAALFRRGMSKESIEKLLGAAMSDHDRCLVAMNRHQRRAYQARNGLPHETKEQMSARIERRLLELANG